MSETPVSAIPALSDDEIRDRVGPQSFQRGREYFRDGAVFEARLQGSTLKARCYGSQGRMYRLRVTFGPNGILDANCSCPVGGGGYCKHVAALLLTWRERPVEFRAVEELDTTLEKRSKEELVALVKQMLRQNPELESLLEVPLPTGGKRQAPIDPEVYRRQVRNVFARAEDHWSGTDAVAEDLTAITSIGEGFARQGDYVGASTVYEAVALGSLDDFESYHDESGAMLEVVSTCVENLGECLANVDEANVRERIFHALFEIYRCDINSGGIGLAEEVPEVILDQTTPEERRMVADWLRETMPAAGGWSSNWKREAYGGFLLDLELDSLDDEAFLRVCRETGRVGDLVDRLLTLGRSQEAVEAASRVSDYELLTLANVFNAYDRGDLADQLMSERMRATKDTRILDWVKNRRKSQGDFAGSLELAEKLFHMHPDLSQYRELRELGTALGRWEAMRPAILASLSERRWHDLLIVIHLDEGEIDEAIEALQSRASPIMGYSYGIYGEESLALQVARAATKTRPQAALDIYRQQVEALISRRNRGSYGEAAQLMVRMGEIYEELGETEQWLRYIEDVRGRYKSLRALKDEMATAGL